MVMKHLCSRLETLWHGRILLDLSGESNPPDVTNEQIPTIVFKGRTLTVPTVFHKPVGATNRRRLLLLGSTARRMPAAPIYC
jgi:hypothetical protein